MNILDCIRKLYQKGIPPSYMFGNYPTSTIVNCISEDTRRRITNELTGNTVIQLINDSVFNINNLYDLDSEINARLNSNEYVPNI